MQQHINRFPNCFKCLGSGHAIDKAFPKLLKQPFVLNRIFTPIANRMQKLIVKSHTQFANLISNTYQIIILVF